MTDCWFCIERAAEDQPPGGWIYEDSLWRAGHTPTGWAPRGTVVLESQRHFLDTSEMTPDEAATFGPVLGRLTGTIREVTDAARVYTWASMVAYPHLHFWLLPWMSDLPVRGPEFLASFGDYACNEEQALETAAQLRKLLSD